MAGGTVARIGMHYAHPGFIGVDNLSNGSKENLEAVIKDFFGETVDLSGGIVSESWAYSKEEMEKHEEDLHVITQDANFGYIMVGFFQPISNAEAKMKEIEKDYVDKIRFNYHFDEKNGRAGFAWKSYGGCSVI